MPPQCLTLSAAQGVHATILLTKDGEHLRSNAEARVWRAFCDWLTRAEY
jgi:hypothetical protein